MEKNKKVRNEQDKKKKKKILLGCLLGVLGTGAVVTAIAVPISLTHKKEPEPVPPEPKPTQTITLTDDDFTGSGSWIFATKAYDLSKGTRVDVTVDTSKFQEVYATATDDFLITFFNSSMHPDEDHDISKKTDLSSISFGKTTVSLAPLETSDIKNLWCVWKPSEYYKTIATFSFNVKDNCGETVIAFSVD